MVLTLSPRVDALGAVRHEKVAPHFQAADLLKDGHAVFFSASRVHRAFVHHDIAGLQGLANRSRRGEQRLVRLVARVDGRGDSDDVKAGLRKFFDVCGERDVLVEETFWWDFFRRVFPAIHHGDASLVDVKSDHIEVLGKGQGNGKAHVPQSDHRHGGFFGNELVVKCAHCA